MLSKLNKLAPYAALTLLAYLTHSALEDRTPQAAQGHEGPSITRRLLSPAPIRVADRASPAGRDPFEVPWASYLKQPKPAPASAPVRRPATLPVAPLPAVLGKPLPPLPGDLVGVFVSDGLTLAVIGDQIYKAGSITGNGDPETNWLVEDVRNDAVSLRFGGQTVLLQMRAGGEPSRGRTTAKGGSR